MSRCSDLEFLEATALRRTRRGGVAQRDGQWLYCGRAMPEGVLLELYQVLAGDGLLLVAGPDEYGLCRVGLTDGRRAVRVGRRSEQIVGRERDRIAARLRERYDQGATIRALAIETGRSFGWVRTLLVEAGAELRGRGGDRRTRRDPEEPGR